MSQPNPSPVKPDPGEYSRNLSSFVLIGGEIGGLTLFIIIVGLILGIWLDRVLGTKPIFTLFLVLGSAPISLVLTYFVAINYVKKAGRPPTAGAQPKKEEEHLE